MATTISFPASMGNYEGNSGTTSFDFIVTRTGDVSGASSATYTVTGAGSFLADASDFAAGSFPTGTVSFAPGETSKTIRILVAGDTTFEPDEGFSVFLSNPIGATIGTNAGAVGNILNDDARTDLATVSFLGPGAKAEGDSGVTYFDFVFTRSGVLSETVSVFYRTGTNTATESDFVGGILPSGRLTFGPGETSKTVSVGIVGDTLVEGNESFLFWWDDPRGVVPPLNPNIALTIIVNDDRDAPLPPTAQEATSTVNTAFGNILKATPSPSDAGMLTSLVSQLVAGTLTRDQALAKILDRADATTSVATMAYEFFTGKIPSAAGMDYLVSPNGPNPNNLNSAYYQSFSIENRNINFAVNLGKNGEGAARFQAEYGALDLFAATTKAYQTIFGAAPTAEKVHALIDSRVDYFAYYGQDGANGIGTKAAMVGWLLAEAEKANIGTYAKSNAAFLMDLADGAAYAVDIVGVYGKPEYAL